MIKMGYLVLAAVLIFGYVAAQDPDCDYRQNVPAGQTFYINNNYSAGRICRYIATCPNNYNCRLDCKLNMPLSPNCSGDRMLISRSGDPTLAAAQPYCGRITVTAVSTGSNMSIGLIALSNSKGGSFYCNLTAQPAAVTPPPACRCGERRRMRIVGGVETQPNEYTMMAGIVENSIESIYCGGVIVAARYVMTAAHCVYRFRQNPAALSVIVGDHYIENPNPGSRYSISRFIIHENYNGSSFDFDISLVYLNRDIQFTEYVLPACLPFKFEFNDFANTVATVLGWGTTSFGGPTANGLRKVDLNVISQSQCRASEGNSVGDRQICTYTRGKDACQFDSGGPLLYTDPSTGLLFSVGIVSNGRMCASTSPGIYTRVTMFLRWIINNANSQFCIIR